MLNVHSYFSFKYGIFKIKELVQWAKKNHFKALALTDINSTSGCLEFVRRTKEEGIKPILGIDFRNNATQQFVGIAKNNNGLYELNKFLSAHLHDQEEIPNIAPLLTDCYILYPMTNVPKRSLYDWEYITVKPYEVARARFIRSIPKSKFIASPTFTLPVESDFELHSVLRAIDLNTLVSKLSHTDTGDKRDVFLSKRALIDTYADLPEAMENLKLIVSESTIDFKFSPEATPQNLKTWTGTEEGDYQKVRQLCLGGLNYRYGLKPSFTVKRRVITELSTIRQKGFLSYFLISWDIITYARKQGYYYVGRGSGANSVVAYLMRITDVDPIELDLYFERFINLFRQNPPDFDIDFSSRERDDVTRYIFERYGNAALLATYSTFQHRAVIREVGKVFGVPPYEIEKIQKDIARNLDYHSKVMLNYGHRLAGFPSHLSVHAGGIIISERPIHYFTATSLPPKGYPITHFDMIIAEDVGLFKFDILGQRGLGKIKDALTIIKENRPDCPHIDIHDINRFKEDLLVKENLRDAKAIGCFYVESPAMRMLLTKLKAEDYLSLVAASSIIRPGVARSGMMREYILRFRMPKKRKEAHPVLWNIMPDTFGIMVYQEDVIKVAHYFAGLTLAEADVLRRGMSGKYRSREEFQQVKAKYFENCENRGYSQKLSTEVWNQIESFAGYAFAKGHSASYAIESYQSLFLKSHYPLEFLVAVINNGGGFYSREFYIQEARRHGATVELPCINNSNAQTIIRGKTIYLGLHMIKELADQTVFDTILERQKRGNYTSIDNFVKRVSVSLEQLSLFIRIDAFRFTELSKKVLLWRAHFILGNTKKSQIKPTLFDPPIKNYKLPLVEHTKLEDIYDQIEVLGFPMKSPFELLVEKPEGYTRAAQFKSLINQKVKTIGYLITTKKTSTSKGDTMHFGNFLDENGDYIDTVHFPPVAKQFPFNGRGIYQIEGLLTEEFDSINLEVDYMKRLNYQSLED